MTTRPFCIALALAACLTCRAQLTIEQCYEKARANYPLIKRYSLIDKTEGIDLARAAKGYLPQLALSAQASVQSDVTDIPIDLSSIGVDGIEIPTMSRDQYKATIDLSQSIWDGGNISSRRKAVRAQAEADRRQTDVSLYAVNARVNRVFFGLLLVDAQLGQNRLLQDELASNCRRVEACMAGGLANQSDADALHVDLAKAIGADGVHLGHEDMPVTEARERLGEEFLIGGTANTFDDVVALCRAGVDYIGCGPFRFTTTKERLAPVLGLAGYAALMARMAEAGLRTPVVAIGGITRADVPALMETGVQGIAVSGAVLRAADPVAEMNALLHVDD